MNRIALAAPVLAAAFAVALSGLAAGPKASDAPAAASLAPLMQKELRWGMSHKDVTEEYDKPMGLLDQEYAPQLARLQAGVQMEQLSADRDSRKANFERSYAEFAENPSGYDVTPLHTEYTYKNDEAIQKLFKDGKTRYFFYIKDHLWKTYDEIPLKAGSPLGDSFQAAVTKLGALLGAQGRVIPGDPAHGVERTTVDWQDSSTHLRAVDRSSEHLLGIVLEDKRTLMNLPSLRVNKPQDPFALDPSISALTNEGVSDPNAHHQGMGHTGDAGAPKHGR
jgi:hypothetical protein